MPTDFIQLIADIEHEAQEEGGTAVSELVQLRDEFRTASKIVLNRCEAKRSSRTPH
jgi:hypothetical protein